MNAKGARAAADGVALVLAVLLASSGTAVGEERVLEIPSVEQEPKRVRPPLLERLIGDYRHYYTGENAAHLLVAFGVGGVLANSPADEQFQDLYQREWRSEGSDQAADVMKVFGEWHIWLPVYAGLAVVGSDWLTGARLGPVGEFGERSVRAMVLGTPPLLLMQRLTGGSRPSDMSPNGSGWKIWDDANGVSGHAFIGAIPFLTAAEMIDWLPGRVLLYAASTLSAWSRVNDNQHYLSQAALGWYMALRAVRSVEASEQDPARMRFDLVPFGRGAGFMVSGRF